MRGSVQPVNFTPPPPVTPSPPSLTSPPWIIRLRLCLGRSQLSRQQLAAELNCPLRDLRVADPTFPGQFPSVLARCGSIIFSVAEVKVREGCAVNRSV